MISSKNCSINKVMGPVPKHSTFWDRSHVMRDQSRLYGTGTPRTHSYAKYGPCEVWKIIMCSFFHCLHSSRHTWYSQWTPCSLFDFSFYKTQFYGVRKFHCIWFLRTLRWYWGTRRWSHQKSCHGEKSLVFGMIAFYTMRFFLTFITIKHFSLEG